MTSLKKVTRFPPEPNGYLHIGHCKSIFINWEADNSCHLRLDDTNPSAEKQEFVDNIIEDVKWLGFDTGIITYSSDHFDKLYEYAIKLIINNFAYVDFSSKEEIKTQRANGTENEYRSKPIEWNLEQFELMRKGAYKENECVLRLKIDMSNNNFTLRDPIAYRINFTPHYRLKNKWVIYPSYDYSHGIIDALENITHSYCTDEFYVRREQYYWPVNKLIELGIELNPAMVHEYGKLSIQNNILSKRNINRLVNENMVSGYSDPRLLTIKGLRRRGFTPSMIKSIVETSSMEKHETVVNTDFIDHVMRTELANSAIRVFGAVDPLEVNIMEPDLFTQCSPHPDFPTPNIQSHPINISSKIYIEKEDFRPVHDKNYYRYTPENIVRLRYNDFTKLVSWDENSITVKKVQPDNPKKVKGCIHWVSDFDAVQVIYELFTDLAPNGAFDSTSKKISTGYIQKYALEPANINKTFQLERMGYFKFDRYENSVPVFIRIIGLYDKNKI
jgi:glutaminyl-tRNA synthetase